MSYVNTLPKFGLVSSAHKPGQKGQKCQKKAKPSKSKSNSNNTMGFSAGRKELWRCVENCGACCKLAKGPSFATPEEIFTDPSDVELYRSLIGLDGWCIHYERNTRTCSIYSGERLLYGVWSIISRDCLATLPWNPTKTYGPFSHPERPYFCRVEPEIFKKLYGIENKKFNKEACSCCRDTIKSIYGPHSKELDNFNRSVKDSGPG